MRRRGCRAARWRDAFNHPFDLRTQWISPDASAAFQRSRSREIVAHAFACQRRASCAPPLRLPIALLCTLCMAEPCGFGVPSGGGRPHVRPASENPQVRPNHRTRAPPAPIGPPLTRAYVPVCVRRCDRARRASERRHRPDGHLPRGHHRGRFHPRRPLRRPPRPLKRGARNVKKIEPVHACAPRYRRERRPPPPPLPPRCPSPRLTSCTA